MMEHRLALQLGCTIGELRSRISNSELRDWFRYYTLEPWGYERDNFLNALNTLSIVNWVVAASGRKMRKRLRVEDFMRKPPVTKKKRAMTPKELMASFGVIPHDDDDS